MSKGTQIESALKQINSAKFQDLCNDLLYYNYPNIFSTGSVIGKEKTRKGSPDSFFPMNDDKYLFVEYTTKEKLQGSNDFYKKLSDDIDHCFDEKSTKIKNSQIEKVILAFTEKLTPEEFDKLRKKCKLKNKNCEFEPYGIDKIKLEVLRYPRLAKDYLDISIDTGQILKPEKYILEYEKSKFATPLGNNFYFRDEELTKAINELETNDILIISGNAGVGKTKLALECSNKFFEKNTNFEAFCISDKGILINDDIRAYLLADKNYLLIIDDANRATKHLEFLLKVLHEDRDGKIKLIVTVRNYALGDIVNKVKAYNSSSIQLNELEPNDLRKIIADGFNIKNPAYLDRIETIARGNPRLAIMAAMVAKDNDLLKLHDGSNIYDKFFETISSDLDNFNDDNLLKVLGITAFFNLIDKEKPDLTTEIYETFSISQELFWEKMKVLNTLEVVDLYENQVVRISDQILSTYFFYKVFFKDCILDYSLLLNKFLFSHKKKIKDTLLSVMNTFNQDVISKVVQKFISENWFTIKNHDDIAFKFLDIFWFFMPTEALIFLYEKVKSETETLTDDDTFVSKNNSYHKDKIFDILKRYCFYSNDNYTLALEISFEYLEKKPVLFIEITEFIKKELIYSKNDYHNSYFRQITLFNTLYKKINESEKSDLYKKVFYKTVNTFLLTFFRKEGMVRINNKDYFNTSPYLLQRTSEIESLRENIWLFLDLEFQNNPEGVFGVIQKYMQKQTFDKNTMIFEFDSNFVFQFIEHNFDKENYLHCKAVHKYLSLLKELHIGFDPELKTIYTNHLYELSKVLKILYDRQFHGGDEFSLYKKETLKNFFEDYLLQDYIQFFSDYQYLSEIETEDARYYNVSLEIIFINLLEENISLLQGIFEHILKMGNKINFSAYGLIFRYLNLLKDEHQNLYTLITSCEYNLKDNWLWDFFKALPKEYTNQFYTDELIKMLTNFSSNEKFTYVNVLEKFKDFTPIISGNFGIKKNNIFTICSAILLKKTKNEGLKVYWGSSFIENFQSYFHQDLNLLKEIYFKSDLVEPNYDYDDDELKILINLDNNFVLEYLIGIEENNKILHYSFSGREANLSYLWSFENYNEIFDKVIKLFTGNDYDYGAETFLKLFLLDTHEKADIVERIEEYFSETILKEIKNDNVVEFIFEVISIWFPEKKNLFLKKILQVNDLLEYFKNLDILSSFNRPVASFIPVDESKIEYLKTVIEMLNSMENKLHFLEHRLYIEEKIQKYKDSIKHWRIREFLDFDYLHDFDGFDN